ncbi:conserved hypothetical protein [Oleispira antarctica RB-8]|uniref:DUF6160 domain-containing protein n=1 Tax=Oleispira antarctica RB-8 TaxID=698738 RepID=R4YT48_OLEAN|nr:conserved hypothetical protein [Oleispira antarctica RB-8]
MNIKKLILCLLGTLLPFSVFSLERLSDSTLSRVQGQSGLTIEQSQLLNIGNLSYTDDGNSLNVQGLRISSQTDINASSSQKYVMDITTDGALSVKTTINPTQMHIDGIRINNSSGSFGDLTLNFESITNFTIRGVSTGGLEGSFTTGISNADMIWQTNGHAMSFNNIAFNASVNNFTFEYDAIDNTKGFTRTGLALGMDNFDFSFSTGALSLGGVSLGELSGDLALSANAQVFGGGRNGVEGLTLHSQVNILSDPENYVKFTDEGNSLLMGDFSGFLNLTNLTLDVESDHLAIGFDQMDGAFNAGKILIGDSSRPIGSIELDFEFTDYIDAGNNANNRYNRLQLYPGIRKPDFNAMPTQIKTYAENFYSGLLPTSEGLSMATQWNLANAEASYIDDGRRVVFSGIESYGSADTTIDVRDQKIAIGMTDLKGSYSIDGLRVGSKTAPLQGGAELLLSLGVYQAMDFDIDGFTEITAGGVSGGGIRIDGDYFFSNTNIGLSIDEYEEGIWATGVEYDIHLRDITFDVESDGLEVNRGEQWSTMDIANLRWGDKTSGRSLGRIKLERFEQNSLLAISPGGAGQVCVGASATSEAACGSGGGRWEDRGNQGMTVALVAKFADESKGVGDSAGARNRFTWENNRNESSLGEYDNDSGTQIIFDNYSTNDGLGTSDDNTYGLKANLNIDVYETKVLKKSTGVDENGVVGSLGEELIFDDVARDSYTYVASPNASQKALRPLGFAVQGNVSFKELNIDAVQLKHPNIPTPQTVFYGVVMQNLNLTTNLTATPIQ